MTAHRPDIDPARLLRAIEPRLREQRWFGDKTRPIRGIVPADHAVVGSGDDGMLLLIAEITFEDGDPVHYSLPLVIRDAVSEEQPLAILDSSSGSRAIVDALRHPPFQAWLLDSMEKDATLDGSHGRFVFSHSSALSELVDAARRTPARVSSAEQSNTSVVYGDALILKALRRLQPGEHPDLEIGRYLTDQTSFRNTPLLAGELTYIGRSGQQFALALAQTFVPSAGDGWSYTLDQLARLTEARNDGQASADWLSAARRLGERTGQLHVAFASGTTDPSFVPGLITREDADHWTQALTSSIKRTVATLKRERDQLPESAHLLVETFVSDESSLLDQARGFDAQVGSLKTRVHGDYHLGQVLRTLDEDFVILDFEGEPSRPMSERRAKISPLKDVAGMLRSFGYARGAFARQVALNQDPQSLDEWLAHWEASTRSAFLEGYRAETIGPGASFVPAEPAFGLALTAWELDKAIYEVNYELNNRPDWLDIPLRGILA